MTESEMIAKFLADKGATKCPDAKAEAIPLRTLRARLARNESITNVECNSEQRSERRAEMAREAKYNGHRVQGCDGDSIYIGNGHHYN